MVTEIARSFGASPSHLAVAKSSSVRIRGPIGGSIAQRWTVNITNYFMVDYQWITTSCHDRNCTLGQSESRDSLMTSFTANASLAAAES